MKNLFLQFKKDFFSKLDKPWKIAAVNLAAAALVWVVFYRPLVNRIEKTRKEVVSLEHDLQRARFSMIKMNQSTSSGKLLDRRSISRVIDQLTRLGRTLNINFVTISPRQTEKVGNLACLCLPISIELESQYKDLGLFLEALENFEESTVTLRSLKMTPHTRTPHLVHSQLTLELYLRE